jgi:hypothetical protein
LNLTYLVGEGIALLEFEFDTVVEVEFE